MTFRFEGLKAGRYAVAMYHDVDGDESLDTNMLGIPREPYGFSNNAVGRFGPPSFDDAAVVVPDEGQVETRVSLVE